jgi:hypothetical protein
LIGRNYRRNRKSSNKIALDEGEKKQLRIISSYIFKIKFIKYLPNSESMSAENYI